MFEAFATIDAVTQMIRSEYGERLSHTTIWKYKRQCWSAERKRLQATRAALFAFAELKSEGRT